MTIISEFLSPSEVIADAGGAAASESFPEASEHNLSVGISGCAMSKGAASAEGASSEAERTSTGVPSSKSIANEVRPSAARSGISVREEGFRS